MRRWNGRTVLLGVLLCLTACGGARGTHMRFAQATPTEIEAAGQSGEIIWYDFEAGDEVPLAFGLMGVAEAVTDVPVRMVARRPFSVVVWPDGRTMFSFDGQSVVSGTFAAAWSMVLGAGPEGGRAGIVLFVGRHEDMPADVRR